MVDQKKHTLENVNTKKKGGMYSKKKKKKRKKDTLVEIQLNIVIRDWWINQNIENQIDFVSQSHHFFLTWYASNEIL